MIREANISDAHSIAEVHVDSWRTTYVGQVPDQYLSELSVPKREASWGTALINKTALIFVSELEGTIQGFISLGPTRDPDLQGGNVGEVYAIYLRHAYQGCGVGQSLWERGTEALRSAEYREATVWVLEANLIARAFYERMGCVLDGIRKTVNIGGQNLEEVRYRVNLK